jgi:protein-S-isoprenylcysteine O-methyltransferase Ste14
LLKLANSLVSASLGLFRKRRGNMTSDERFALLTIWLLWLTIWCVWALRTKAVKKGESVTSEVAHQLPLAAALAMLWPWRLPFGLLDGQVLPPLGWVGVALTAGGMLFMVWARVTIGTNWSGRVTIKQDHVLVDRGPYGIVRHPIYTGLLAAYVFTGLSWGDWRGLIAPAVAMAALWRKLRLEEAFLAEQFGGAYGDYRRRTRALIPYIL